jgi:hypothetical protein
MTVVLSLPKIKGGIDGKKSVSDEARPNDRSKYGGSSETNWNV